MSFESALASCEKHWREFFMDDPERARIEFRIARGARIMATTPRASPIYAEALSEWHRDRDLLRKLLEKRYAPEP